MSAAEDDIKAAFAALKDEKWNEAEHHARTALRSRPTSARALYALASAVADYGDGFESVRLYKQAIHIKPKFLLSYHPLSRSYYGMGRREEAAELYRGWAEIEPNNPEVQHMAAAATGEDVPQKCSDGYVQTHFNNFATNFDDVLIKKLAYKGPEVITAALTKHLSPAARSLDVLDAGCGTGLCGPAIREYCRTLTGVDLADKMVEHARTRGCYDELVISELCAFMEARPQMFDAVVSSDVLIYFGALERAMSAAYTALRSGSAFIYALEALMDPGSEPYRLTASGRYAHRETYLRNVMAATRLKVVDIEQVTLRWEMGKEVPFYCCVARKP